MLPRRNSLDFPLDSVTSEAGRERFEVYAVKQRKYSYE